MSIYAIDGIVPVVDPAAFVHPDATLIGDVVVEADCYVGPGASLRGDMGRITLLRGGNVQDNCIVHCFPGKDMSIGPDGHVGHGAVLHGCNIGPNVLIGMSAVVMDEADIGHSAFVAALAFVKAGTLVPPRSLAAGIPAKVVRELSDKELAWKKSATATYQALARRSLATLRPVVPLAAVESNRPRLPAIDVKSLHDTKRG
jgi:phenylacetic acid degradation protein